MALYWIINMSFGFLIGLSNPYIAFTKQWWEFLFLFGGVPAGIFGWYREEIIRFLNSKLGK